MEITKDTIKSVAGLSKLKFSDAELETFEGDFGKILQHMEVLDQLEPESVTEGYFQGNILREDKVVGTDLPKQDKYYTVPRTVSGEE